MIPAMGPKNTAYPDMKLKNTDALETISQGTRAQPPMIEHKMVPRLILIHLGHKVVTSLAKLTELAEILQHT